MARLKPYTADRSISTGEGFMRFDRSSDQTGRAIAGIGRTVSALGASMLAEDNRQSAKAEADMRKMEALETEREVLLYDQDSRLKLKAASENITPSGRGFYDGFMSEYDKGWQAKLSALPESVRPEAELKFLRDRERIALQAATIEANQRNNFTVQVATEKRDSLTNGILTGMMTHEYAKQDVDTFVKSLPLSENSAKVLTRQLGMAIDAAHIQRQINLQPSVAMRELKKYMPNAVRSDNKIVQGVIEAAERHGLPVNIVLGIVKGESSFNPNADMSKEINPRTGKPYSSAYGLWQMIDANWAETGIAKTNDPALQAEAGARLLARRKAFLESNGFEVTPRNLWGAHFVGPGGIKALLRADPRAPLRDVLLPVFGAVDYRAATTGNGSILQDGATVGQTLQRIQNYVEKNMRAAGVDVQTGPSADPNGKVSIGGIELSHMTGQDIPKYMALAMEATAKQTDDTMKTVVKQRDERGGWQVFESADRTEMDKYEGSRAIADAMTQGDMTAYGSAAQFVNKHKYLPKPMAAAAQAAILSQDTQQKAAAFDLLSKYEAENPIGGLEFSGIRPEIRKRIDRYNALRYEMRMPVDQALAEVDRQFSPDFAKATKSDAKAIQDAANLLTIRQIESDLESRTWLGWGSSDFGNDSVKRKILGAYRDRYVFHRQDGAPDETARHMAKRDMKRAYGVDTSFGSKRLMHWPLDKVFPAGPDGTRKWVAEAAVDYVNNVFAGNPETFPPDYRVDASKVYLLGTAETGRMLTANQNPRYQVVYIDHMGRQQTLPGGFVVERSLLRLAQEEALARRSDKQIDVATERREKRENEQRASLRRGRPTIDPDNSENYWIRQQLRGNPDNEPF